MCACMRKLGHRALTPEHAILNSFFFVIHTFILLSKSTRQIETTWKRSRCALLCWCCSILNTLNPPWTEHLPQRGHPSSVTATVNRHSNTHTRISPIVSCTRLEVASTSYDLHRFVSNISRNYLRDTFPWLFVYTAYAISRTTLDYTRNLESKSHLDYKLHPVARMWLFM